MKSSHPFFGTDECRARLDAAHPCDYEREQVQSLPHVHVAPQLQPGRRVSLFFLDICSSFISSGRLHAGIQTDDARPAHPLHLPAADILASWRRAPVDVLLENHRAFLRYLERRVGDHELAEEILQDAFIKVTHVAPEPEMSEDICACISRLAVTLKPEYAEALQAIDVQGTPVKTFAEQRGLSTSNAGVRIFRAREALKKRVIESCGTCAEHGCVNCTCRTRC